MDDGRWTCTQDHKDSPCNNRTMAGITSALQMGDNDIKDNNGVTNGNKKRLNEDIGSASPSGSATGETNTTNDSNKRTKRNLPVVQEVQEVQSTQPKKKPKKTKQTTKKDSAGLELTWICTECREAECATQPDSPLLVCEGQCSRPFHYPCAGLASLPPAEQEWWCNDCTEKRHQCASCHEYGTDQVDLYKCEKQNCGLFFHESCLNMYDVDIRVTEIREKVGNHGSGPGSSGSGNTSTSDEDGEQTDVETDGSHVLTVPKFVCPAHHCWTCSGGVPPRMEEDENGESNNIDKKEEGQSRKKKGKKGKQKKKESLFTSFMEKKERLFRCLECPHTYHISCIPPHAVFHELALLCHEHATTSKLPYLDVKESLQGQVEDRTDALIEKLTKKKTEKVTKKIKSVDGSNSFLIGLKGDGVAKYDREIGKLFAESDDVAANRLGKMNTVGFCAPCSIQKEVHSKPPVYTHVHSNQYNKHRPKRHPPIAECCQCQPKEDGITCDEHCMNRMMGIECVGNGNHKSGKKNPYWNCNQGQECGNRKLSRRQFAKCKPKREQGKGWGLAAVNGAKQGSLIQEYAGEIIDEKTKRERLDDWAKDHPNDPNFYIMSLEPGWYIDARVKGNLSRFINHSCGPNCHLAPLNVGGHTRVAIIAKRDIRPGEFLRYDYQFDTRDRDKFLCRCGAPECRGSMKGGSNNTDEDEKKKTKKDIWAEAKSKFDKDKKFLEDLEKDQVIRMNQIGVCLPGEVGESARAVASLPSNAFRSQGVCLWRNTVTGADFASRYLRITSQKRKEKTPEPNCLQKIDVLSKINS